MTGLRGSRASRYSPSHQLSVNTTADSAAMTSVWHVLQTVAAVPATVVTQGTQKVNPPEGRPVRFGEPHLRVGALPEQEAGQPLLPGSTDDQVGVGLARCVEVLRDRVDGDGLDQLLGGGAVGDLLAEQSADRVGDLLAAAIADRDVDVETGG